MLRSFDYAARHLLADHPADPQLRVPRRRSGQSATATPSAPATPRPAAPTRAAEPVLLRAFETDKAVYEVGLRGAQPARPGCTIPMAAIRPARRPMARVSERLTSRRATDPRRCSRPPSADARPVGADAGSPAATARPVDRRGAAPAGLAAPTTTRTRCSARTRTTAAVTVRTPASVGDRGRRASSATSATSCAHESYGVWVGVLPGDARCPTTGSRSPTTARRASIDDPYRFLPTLGEIDLHLIGEGRHEELWEVLGAHTRTYDGIAGTVSAARPSRSGRRAPRACGSPATSTTGTAARTRCARWAHRRLGALRPGRRRRRALQVRDPRPGRRVAAEGRPDGVRAPRCRRRPRRSSSRSDYEWGDDDVAAPTRRDPTRIAAPMSTYEVHLGSWRQGLCYRELADQLVGYVQYLGFTHVELLPVAEHPFGGSWGYQVSSYFAPTSRFGTPDDFRYLVDRLHQAGIGVIVDWVPGALPQGRVGAGPLRRHPALRAPRPAPRRAAGLGHVRLRLRPQRGAQLPGRQRAVLARGVPHRRAAGRRRRLDALPRLLPRGGRVGAQRVRRPGEPRGGRRSCRR